MTKTIDKSKGTDSQARKTVFIVAIVLLVMAAWNFYQGRTTVVAIMAGLAAAFAFAGLALPEVTRRFHDFWMKLAAILGYVNSRVLLGVIFYGVFTPYGFVSRLAGRDPLHRRGEERDSYWKERKNTRQAREQFERLF